MARRSGLGKGLGALIPGDLTHRPSQAGGYRELPIGSIRPNPHQPREEFDEQTLASLAASIAELGILQPLLVRPAPESAEDGAFELIAGERRLRAAKRAGLQVVPVLVKEADDLSSLEHAVVENLHRQDLNPLEEAAAYRQLLEDFEMTHDALAKRVGKSRAGVTNLLRLLQLPPSVQKLVRDGQLTEGHAKVLLGTPNRALQEALAKKVVAEGLSVRGLEDAMRAPGDAERASEPAGAQPSPTASGANRKVPGATREPGLLELEQLLGDLLNTRVTVELGPAKGKPGRGKGRGGHGKVVIEFADVDDLERIYRTITGTA